MLVQSINPTQSNTNFRSRIIGKEIVNSAAEISKGAIEVPELKNLNFCKRLLDSLNKIKNDTKVDVVEFVRTSEGINILADNKQVLEVEKNNYQQDSYVAYNAITKYADTINVGHEKTALDLYQTATLKAMQVLEKMKEAYGLHVKHMLDEIK